MATDAPNLASTLDGITKGTGGPTLRVDAILSELPEEEASAFRRALQDEKRVSGNRLSEVMSAAGHRLSPAAIRKWRQAPGNVDTVG